MAIEAKIGQMAAKVAQETAKQGANQAANMPAGGESSFTNVLQQQEAKVNSANSEVLKSMGYDVNAHPADNAVTAKNLDFQISNTQELDSVQSKDKIAGMITQLNNGGLQMEKLMEMVSSGAKFSNRELMLVQASMHQLTFEAEIAVRSMDAMKTVVQTLVQRTTQ